MHLCEMQDNITFIVFMYSFINLLLRHSSHKRYVMWKDMYVVMYEHGWNLSFSPIPKSFFSVCIPNGTLILLGPGHKLFTTYGIGCRLGRTQYQQWYLDNNGIIRSIDEQQPVLLILLFQYKNKAADLFECSLKAISYF